MTAHTPPSPLLIAGSLCPAETLSRVRVDLTGLRTTGPCRVGVPVDASDLQAVSSGECSHLLDAGDGALLSQRSHCLKQMVGADLGMVLGTLSAYDLDVGAAFVEALLRRGLIRADALSRVRTALHEAIANAIIHGNLELPSPRREDAQDFVTFAEAISERLLDPAYFNRCLTVCATAENRTLVLRIRNEGPGFNPSTLRPDRDHGGWSLILAGADTVAFDSGGHCLTLCLPLPDGAPLSG